MMEGNGRKIEGALVYIKCWGTRGSLPHATSHAKFLSILEELVTLGRKSGLEKAQDLLDACRAGKLHTPVLYGGNTTCTEIGHNGQVAYVDMGSGFREAGTAAMQQGVKEFHIFMTHMHWDHVMGMPFFIPVHIPGHKLNIYHVHKNAPEYVRINFNGVNFPLSWDQVRGTVEFHQLKLYEPTAFGSLKVTPFVLDHPGGSFGYRFDADGKSLAIGVDGEYKRLTPKELGKDLPYFQNLDLLLFDAQYEMSELASRFDWGHCSPNIGVDLALREGIKTLLFTHHDPWSTEEKLRRMYANTVKYMKSQLPSYKDFWDQAQVDGPRLLMAYDGLTIEL
jgi:phosphoribosyl 1,2-cyclic phosphodiesterase